MNFDLDDEQREFAAVAGEFFAEQGTLAEARRILDDGGTPRPGLKAVADIGFYGITVPEAAGGAGRQVIDAAVVAEQAGRFLSAPSLVTAARAAVLLAGDDTRLAALADGSTAFAVIDGDAPSIDAASADQFIALVGDDIVIGRGEVTVPKPLDATRGLGRVRLTDTEVVRSGGRERWERARLVGTAVLAAEDLGAATRVLEMTLEYGRMRSTFGRAIGSYQAVKHVLVDVYTDVEQLRSLVWWAAWAADAAADELPLAASCAAAQAATTLDRAAETAVQLHGGIGFTWEHDAHLYWRRAKVDRMLLGDEVTHLDKVAGLALAVARR
jgi:alkylation response protein AidB-like acyl-CoA dehydrogenase